MLRSDFVLAAPLGTGTRDLYRGRGCSVKWLPAMWTLITQLITLKSSDLVLKREQKEAFHAVCVEKRDCLCVLPTGFGKSLIFQLDPSTLDYLTKVNNSCVLVVSPLNAIISDQIEKLESRGIGVKVFKQGYQGVVTTIDDDVKFIYGHAEVFAENDSVKRLLRSPFKDRIKTIVIDEAHFIIQW